MNNTKSNCVFLINIFKIYFYIFVHHKSTNPDNQQLYKINKIIITKYCICTYTLYLFVTKTCMGGWAWKTRHRTSNAL